MTADVISVSNITAHAVARFRERFGGKKSDAVIRRDMTGLLYSAEEVCYRGRAPRGTSKYFQTDGVVFVVQDGSVITVILARDNWEPVRP